MNRSIYSISKPLCSSETRHLDRRGMPKETRDMLLIALELKPYVGQLPMTILMSQTTILILAFIDAHYEHN